MTSEKENMNIQQDEILNTSKQGKKNIKFILKNGVHMEGYVEAFDRYVVVIRQTGDKQAMIYKSAFSTIIAS
ncbi:RNA chaperone Hfq [Ammoniphilus sp. 3BR4]